jgi:hypothetical protein
MNALTDISDEFIEGLMIENEAFRLGREAKDSNIENSMEMSALLEVCTPDERIEARYWFAQGLIISA